MKTTDEIVGPYVASFDMTYHCTLRCKHCFNVSGEQNLGKAELSDDEILNVCRELVKFQPKVVCLCGGEPLLRKDLICKVCSLLVEKSHGNTKVNVVTNGELMTRETAKQIKNAKFQMVQVSIDGASPRTHDWLRNKKGAFEKAVNAVKYLKDEGMHVGVACVPTLYNLSEIDEILELCEKLGVNDFRMQPLMPLGRAITQLKGYIPQYKDYRKLSLKLNYLRYKNQAENKMSIEWGDPVDHLIRFRTLFKDNCIHISISAYGDISLSPYLPVTIGNVRRHSLEEYWNNGLSKAWNIPIVNYFAERMMSASKLRTSDPDIELPTVYLDKGIDIDLIDDDIFNTDSAEILKEYAACRNQ